MRQARNDARGARLGTLGLLAFAVVAAVTVTRWPLWAALTAATVAWAVVALGAYLVASVAGFHPMQSSPRWWSSEVGHREWRLPWPASATNDASGRRHLIKAGYAAAMLFEPGKIINRRYLRGRWCTWVQPMRVIADNEDGLLLWHPAGSDFAKLVDSDGKTPHEVAPDQMRDPKLTITPWQTYDILVLMPPQAAYSVWWFFRDGAFDGWYVNLESPYRRQPDGVDVTDLVLDIVVSPDRQWEWKDVDEFDGRIGHPLYFDRATADAVRAEGERLIKLIAAGDFPFDGTYTDFRPDQQWPMLRLPAALDPQPGLTE